MSAALDLAEPVRVYIDLMPGYWNRSDGPILGSPNPVEVGAVDTPCEVEVPAPLGRVFGSNGYSNWKLDAADMKRRTAMLAKHLPAFMAELDADFVAVRGTSGTFIAGALLATTDIQVLLMRKPGDNCHGLQLEGNLLHTYKRGIILDDFVSSGATARGMLSELAGMPMKIVGILEHYQAGTCPEMRISGKSLCDGATCNVFGIDVHLFREILRTK